NAAIRRAIVHPASGVVMRGVWLAMGLVVLQGLDFGLTRLLLSGEVRDDVYEANVLARCVLGRGGWVGLAAFKGLCTLVTLGAALLVLRWRPPTGRRLLAGLCLVMFGVVGYSAALASGVASPGQREMARIRSESRELVHACKLTHDYMQ